MYTQGVYTGYVCYLVIGGKKEKKQRKKRDTERDRKSTYPERVSLRNVLFSRDGFLFLLDFHAGREGHGIHQPPGSFTGSSATRLLERLRDLHKVRDVVSEVTNVRQGVHGPTRCFRPSALGFGKRHPGEEILFDFRPRLHARELAFRKRGRRIPDVAAQFLGGLAQFLREFLWAAKNEREWEMCGKSRSVDGRYVSSTFGTASVSKVGSRVSCETPEALLNAKTEHE